MAAGETADGTRLLVDRQHPHDLFMEQGLESFRAVTKQFIEKAEVVDAQHVKFTFKPDSKVRERLQSAGGLPVMSKAWFDKTKARLDKSRMETKTAGKERVTQGGPAWRSS